MFALCVVAAVAAVAAAASGKLSDEVINAEKWDKVVSGAVEVDGELHSIDLNTFNYSVPAAGEQEKHLQHYVDSLANVTSDDLAMLVQNKSKFMAFWINAYNALAVHTITQNPCQVDLFGECGPIQSIRDIAYGFWPWEYGVWTKTAARIAGKDWSLDEVEMHLRQPPKPLEEDSRLHAAIVCASVSCPNLRPRAYTWQNIDTELTQNFNNFMDNTGKGMKIDTDSKTITLTPIMKWFEGDFKPSPLDFAMRYIWANHSDYDWLKSHYKSATVEHFTYDWDANAVPGTIPCSVKARPCFRPWHLLLTCVIILAVALIVLGACCIARRCRKGSGYHRVN